MKRKQADRTPDGICILPLLHCKLRLVSVLTDIGMEFNLLFVLILTARIAFKRSAQHSTVLNVVGSNPMWNNTIRSTNGCSQSGYSLYPFHVLL